MSLIKAETTLSSLLIFRKPVDAKIDAKEEEEYIRDVEAATGIKLEGKTRGGKRKRHNGDSSNEPIAVRERLNVSGLFIKGIMLTSK